MRTLAPSLLNPTQHERPVLARGWKWTRLGDVATYINGRAFKPEDWSKAGIPIIRIQNLTSENASFNYYDKAVDTRYCVKDGDLLISWSASLDAFMWNRGPAILNQHIFKVIENTDIIIRGYLYFAARSAMASIRERVHGATMQHITKPEFEAVAIPMPPLPEQQRIVALLSEQLAAVDQTRVAAEAQLQAARQLPAAYLRSVFGGAEMQMWARQSLGSLCQLLPSKSIATSGDAPVLAITTACLTEAGFNPAGIKTARMWADDAQECVVAAGEILIARSNTAALVGRVSEFPGDVRPIVASDLTIRLLPVTEEATPSFIAAYLSYLYLTGYWRERAGGASDSMKKITRAQVQHLLIPLPSLAEQQRIQAALHERIQAVGQLRAMLDAQLAAVSGLPSALLHRAFAGGL